jgi:hypothetical protein
LQVLYYERWREVLNNALFQPIWVTRGRAAQQLTFQNDRGQNVTQIPWLCNLCNVNLDILYAQFIRDLKHTKTLPNFETLGDNITCCIHVRPHIQAWHAAMKQQVQQIPTFDKFM